MSLGGGLFTRAAFSQIPSSSTVTTATPSGPTTTNPSGLSSPTPQASQEPATSAAVGAMGPIIPALSANLTQYQGLRVESIHYEGVEFDKSDRLTGELTQKVGEPFDADNVRQTTRRLFATGRYQNIAVRVVRNGDAVTLIFAGVARSYIGRIQINGVKEERLASLLEYGTQLNPGTAYSPAQLPAATEAVRQVLAQNGYYEPVVAVQTERDPVGNQVNVTYTVSVGPQARVGNIVISGTNPGISLATFRKKGKLKPKNKVTRETTSNALSNLRGVYQKQNRLEATLTLQKSTYDPATKRVNYEFQAEQGPVVKVLVDGIKISKSRLHLLVPIFEEGTIDNDLLNEGRFKIQDFMEQSGYSDAKVSFAVEGAASTTQTVRYTVDKGIKHKVVAVEVTGNKYFGSQLLVDRLAVHKADAYQRVGRYSTQLVKNDATNLEGLYRANGFNSAKVTSSIKDFDEAGGKNLKVARVAVTYTVVEGTQQKFGSVDLNGIDPSRKQVLSGLLGATPGQPFSLVQLSGDRDALLSWYVSNGFDQAKLEVKQTIEGEDKSKTDVAFNVIEGQQVFVGKVLESGVQHTRQSLVDQQTKVHAGDPLDQSALLETQRNLYNLALFNEVVAAVQNPDGDAEQKNVLLQITEAKRWDVTYGVGFEAQTGLPSRGIYSTAQGTTAAQQGKAGVSPRVSVDVSRINLRGTDNSLTLHTAYGLLEQIATLSFQDPHFRGNKNLALQISGGYTNVQDITTFAAKTLQADLRLTQKATRKDTFIYDFVYRRVEVDPNSLEISPDLIPQLSQPVRVGGPQVTWFHDTRTPSALDATKGSYTSVVDFYASSKVGSQTDFNRTDISNSTYYAFGKRKYVFARNTRVGFIANFGVNPNAGNAGCAGALVNTNASCNPIPLPERLYAGGATSHRGFPINGAGPRDLQTGYPVGGSGVFVNSLELRMPAPTLPVVGSSISFVVFHDMGNVFQQVSQIGPSFGRFHQPNVGTCKNLTGVNVSCNFNYFSHAIGLGARYATPVGPIRVDFSYNLNPPTYPVEPNSGVLNAPFVGTGSHFNFFFSIGQSF
ncbi:surface antigen (D15) [Granulicella tundricola MP5ACTX9]|uniref:Surface antigen (D15) n=2 Tax=Granulicella TaxID=940557 RepID=E8WWK4_GRATM|nr:surface antigen (D15) [Granulicella tundricola MP5ACTX9]